ncbi:MAG: nucleotidyltransferase domain-containing protein [Candidatus Pacearchaeota archaeon]
MEEKKEDNKIIKTPENIKKILKQLCSPIFELNIVKSVFFYGSAVKKGLVKGHDIDIFIAIDETIPNFEEEEKKLDILLITIQEKAKKEGIEIHFQPPKTIGLIWHLIHIAEPWTISAIRTSIILYDKGDFIRLIKNLLAEGKIYSINEKSERLFYRAINYFLSAKKKLLEIPFALLNILTIISQIILSYLEIRTSSATDTLEKLRANKKEIGISNYFLETYNELIKINEKIYKGTFGEFSGEEIDLWMNKIKLILNEAKNIIKKLEEESKRKRLEEAYNYGISLCKKVVKEKDKNDKKILYLFEKEFVKKNKIPESYYDILKNLYSYIHYKKTNKKLINIDKNYFKGMEILLNKLERK